MKKKSRVDSPEISLSLHGKGKTESSEEFEKRAVQIFRGTGFFKPEDD